ncbi:MAG TPA: glycine cleavage system protein GcvH [Planctomycetes bacterium]|nr:glycine cleavage system protein GcvH [Planctomycetota bacterium]
MRPDDRKYTKTHEWVKRSGDNVLIGITDFAVQELCSGNEGDLVYCDLPEPGRVLEAGETFGEIESVKAVADLNTPVAGTVAEVNVAIEEHLEILSKDPFQEGWMLKITPKTKNFETDDMMDAAAYEEFVASAETH